MSDRESSSASGPTLPESMGGLTELLDIELVEVTAGRVVATMPVTPKHHQPFGYLHGGATVALAETVASVGANAAAPDERVAFGMEINANHLQSVREGQLVAVAMPLHTGQSSQVWEVKVRDEEERLVCVSRCTLAVVTRR